MGNIPQLKLSHKYSHLTGITAMGVKLTHVNTKLTPKRTREFLKELEKTGNLQASAAHVDVSPGAIYTAARKDRRLKDAIELARHKASHAIETELRRRGIEGYEEKVFFQGEQIGTQTRYSDRLLELLAKGNMEKYGKTSEMGVNINIGAENIKTKLASLLGVEIKKEEEEVIEGEFRELD
jgi:hypothetical protein